MYASGPVAAALSITLALFSTEAIGQSRFAVIGDYGDSEAAGQVADLIARNNADFIVTVGDNCYETTPIAQQVGSNYGAYVQRRDFWPTLGNHEYSNRCGGVNGNIAGYLSYFTLPNNERYYDFVVGPVHFFAVNSNGLAREPHGNTARSRQGRWMKRRITAAKEPWKVVFFHHPPYSSGEHRSTRNLRWPFEAWGVHLVLSGHDHNYERILRDDDGNGKKLAYVISGLGGRPPRPFGEPVQGSVFRYNADNGALFVTATSTSLKLEFRDVSGALIDSYTVTK